MKRWGMLGWGGGEIINIDDSGGVVGEERLEFREEQVQCVGNKGWGEEQRVLTALCLLEEVILDQCQKNLKWDPDVIRITEVAVSGINEATKIRELYRALCEIPETEKEKDANKMEEVEKEWEAMGGISEVNSADQIDQLEALRYKMKSKNYNLPSSKSVEISGNEMPRTRNGIPKA